MLVFGFIIELLFELIGELVAEGLFELVFELIWHSARFGRRAGAHAVRITRIIDVLACAIAAAIAWRWGAHLGSRAIEEFPWSIVNMLVLTLIAVIGAATNLSTPTTWHRIARFDRSRFARLALLGMTSTTAMFVGYIRA